ncbi:MAG TPA: hypothetical protein VFX05_05220 [Casimicrobiaceae bacterium]|nr:hypothetical protein [Casimicrobiaceae bacterium]
MDAIQKGWRGLREVGPWVVLDPVLPGATLFALLVWLSFRFVREGFGGVRQYGNAPLNGAGVVRAAPGRRWWSCTCRETCACLAALAGVVRRCCAILRAPAEVVV